VNRGASNSDSRYSAPAAACAAEQLTLLARSPEPLSLAEMARRLDRSKSLVFRVTKELESRGLIRDAGGGRYWLGIETLELGGAYISQADYATSARQVLRELSNETGETVNLGTLLGAELLYLERWEGANSVVTVSHVGKRIPANCTALGKSLLAALPDAEVRRRFRDSYPALTRASLSTFGALKADLDGVRARGYAVDRGEVLLGRCCVGAAIPRQLSTLPSDGVAISISTTEQRWEEESDRLISALLAARDKIEREWTQRASMTGRPT